MIINPNYFSSSRVDDSVERNKLANAPHLNFLVMNSQTSKGPLAEVKKINSNSMRILNDPESYDPPEPIIEVEVETNQEKFHSMLCYVLLYYICCFLLCFLFILYILSLFFSLVLVDGCVYGPFHRIRIRPCSLSTSSNQSILTLPVMTFLPIATS